MMIRNVVMVRMPDGHDPGWLAERLQRLSAINTPGTVAFTTGPDLGLREGGWTCAIVADFADADAFRLLLSNETHLELQSEFRARAKEIARVQFEH